MNDSNDAEQQLDLPATEVIDLRSSQLYLNRELSLLEFNQRVLAQALDETTPLLERLLYLCISSTNLDEFYEIRVAGLKQMVDIGSQRVGPDGLVPQELLKAIAERVHNLVEEQYRILNDIMFPALADEGIRFIRRAELNPSQQDWLRNYFEQEVLPVLSPMGLDPAHPFPKILNKGLHFIVELEGKDAFGRQVTNAVVGAPRALPRLIQLPDELPDTGPSDFVFLSSVIHQFVDELFPGLKVGGCYQFRVTRNSDLYVDEEEVDDLKRALEGELLSRRYGDEVRLEVADDCPVDLYEYLLERFGLNPEDVYLVNGPVNFSRIVQIRDLVDRPDLKFPGFTPFVPKKLEVGANVFTAISKRDYLLHHPFDSFLPVIELVRQASVDPQVLAIKQTLYRTGPDSAIVDALVAAARSGKEVTVVIEIRARFDEQANITLANRLQAAGAQVAYGVVGHKTHAKMLLVLRREDGKLRHYAHLGTGNYHASTARLYTDYGLLTADKAVGRDMHKIFMQLTGLGKVSKLELLLQSPFTLHKGVIAKIEREAENARAGKPARIIAKMNALVEQSVIEALYKASQAGVQIDLIVRGICCLRPGVKGVSENIRVVSIIGRFLEHTRVYYFENSDANYELFGASADWMDRNLFHRVETCFPLTNKKLRERILADLELYLSDNTQAWDLQQDGTYQQIKAGDAEPVSAQRQLLEQLTFVA